MPSLPVVFKLFYCSYASIGHYNLQIKGPTEPANGNRTKRKADVKQHKFKHLFLAPLIEIRIMGKLYSGLFP